MSFYTNGEALFSWVSVPAHLCGWGELAHGGVITTILDEIMGWSAIYLLKSITMTKSITVDFLKPVHIGRELRAEGRLVERISMKKVLMEGLLFEGEETLCATAKGTFAVFTEELAARKGMLGEDNREFLDLIKSC
jgi:uncharacterized protein (TIGR00369 family)